MKWFAGLNNNVRAKLYFQTSMLDSYVHHFCHDTHFQLQQYSVTPDISLINSCRGLRRKETITSAVS